MAPRGLVPVLIFDALCGASVAGLGTPLIPEVARVERVSLEAATWVLTVTLIVGATVTPIVSRLGDGGHRRRVLVAALATIAFGSLVAAGWHSFLGMLVGRAWQGIGYALVPLTIAVASEHLRGEQLRRTLGILSVSTAIGVGLANPLIGVFVKYLDYRAAFLFTGLITVTAALLTLRTVPRVAAPSEPLGLDVAGALLLASSLACVLLAISRGVTWGWLSAPVALLLLAGLVLLSAWAQLELRDAQPLIDLRLASSPDLLGVNLTAFCTGVGLFGGMALVYRVVQAPAAAPGGLGQPMVVAGLLVLPMSVGSLTSPPIARSLARRFGVRAILPLGSAVEAVGFVIFAFARDELWQICLVAFLAGIGIGIAYSIMPAVIVARTPPERTSSAAGLNTVLRVVGGAVGAAAIASVLAAFTPARQAFPTEGGYVAAALLAAALCLAAMVVSVVFVRNGIELARLAELPDNAYNESLR
jgi:MFS family permease